jgi:LytS/YehU family sensor histidine kinase
MIAMREGGPQPFLALLPWRSVLWYGWALLAPGVFLLALRFPFSKRGLPASLLIHIAGCLAAYLVHVSLQVASMSIPRYQEVHATLGEAVTYHLVSSLYLNVLLYWIIVGVAHAFSYYQQNRQRELRAAQLESDLARAQLRSLRMQLHPHFLFNTLNGISTLMHRDVDAADRMVAQLSDLLRMAVDSTDTQEVPLHEEIHFLEKYLEIEQIRFEDRLAVELDVAPEVEDALVPNLILQPLVENAVKHGIAPRSAPGRVRISAWRDDGSLRLRVADDGPGLPAVESPSQNGTGLSNTRARLLQLYGSAHTLAFRAADPSGLIVDLTLPLRHGDEA